MRKAGKLLKGTNISFILIPSTDRQEQKILLVCVKRLGFLAGSGYRRHNLLAGTVGV